MDLYRILGVGRKATPGEIKKAFREKAKKYHPDINPEHQEYFKQLTHAYDILIDPEKRKRYDLTLKKIEKKELGQIIGDLLADFLGFHTRPVKGEDIKVKLKISLEEGFYGTEKSIRYRRKVKCSTCNGTGITYNSRIRECERCRGRGRQKKAFIEIPCFSCFGRGVKIENPCPLCKGSGRIWKHEVKKIAIPAGITEKQTIMVEKGGNQGINGGDFGNLYIKVSFLKDSKFKIKGLDLITEVRLKDKEYPSSIVIRDIEGNFIEIPVEEKRKKPLKIRIKERGYTNTRGKRGDLIVKIF